jgi:B12-binding domain/radical SAM domain protein
MSYDVVFMHPPSVYDFRKRPVFSGPIAYTVGSNTQQFIEVPVGMLSIADYLERNGYRVLVYNLGDRMVADNDFDVEDYIKKLSAKVYGIDLHWCVHCQGALEIAKLCKQLHPEAKVVMGGLTSTVFAEEIISKYDFIDAVIRGEAEKPFLSFMKAMEKGESFETVPNITFRDNSGIVKNMPLMEPNDSLDEFDFTRLDLLEPKRSIFSPAILPNWTLPIYRGCIHNCVACGGSAYSYGKYFGRKKLACRSPGKILQDIHKLSEQGIQIVYIFHDPRNVGTEYWKSLVKELQNGKIKLSQLTMELYGPADEEYIRELSKIGVPVVLTISPESLVEGVRRTHGRNYTNEDLLNTARLCKQYGISLGIFTMIALAEDTEETIKENWKVNEQICSMNLEVKGKASIRHAFGPMILLDPGSLAFDFPDNNGYKLLFKNLEEYANGMSLPSWHQWISYETKNLDKDLITKFTIDSIEDSIN